MITKTYSPDEIKNIQERLRDIVNVWLKSDQTKPLEDWIILALYKQNYKIVKTGK